MTRPDGSPPPEKPRSRLEDEVLEILYKTDKPASFADHVRRKAARRRRERIHRVRQGVRFRATGYGGGTYLIASFALAVAGMLVGDASPLLAKLLGFAATAAFVMIWVERYRRPDRSAIRTWRGRDIDLSPPPPAWVENLRDRFRRPTKL